MRKYGIFLFAAVAVMSCCRQEHKLTDMVDPYIGSGGHGHVFVGASVPYGMVQLGPQQPDTGWDWCSGYHYSGNEIIGFSHTRLSGTGIGELGDILLMPFDPGRVKYGKDGHVAASLDHSRETARPGYYSICLDDYGVKAELTATDRTGVHRYTFSSDTAAVLVDLTTGVGWDKATDCLIDISHQDGYSISGYRRSSGWAKDHVVYFHAEFSLPVAGHSFSAMSGSEVSDTIYFDTSSEKTLEVKVALSPVSEGKALANLRAEVPDWDFDAVRKSADSRWEKALGKIRIVPMDERQETIFYTALYHTMIAPSLFCDTDFAYRGADGNVHAGTGETYTVFSLWDTYRAASPLMTIIDRDMAGKVGGTMLDIYEKQGKLPVWHLAGNETDCMVGNPGVIVLADLYLKGIVRDSMKVLEALKTSSMRDERGMELLKEYGYIPFDRSKEVETVAKGLEFAIADAAVARVAATLGDTAAVRYFGGRSRSYRYYFDPATRFMRGRASDGSFRTPFDPFSAPHMKSDYTEGNAWQYTWLVPHDVHGLETLLGGDSLFVDKLDSLFTVEGDLGGDANDVSGLIGQYAHGNEPSHHVAYLYSYAGRQDRCSEIVRTITDSLYFDTHEGVCGNEDAGQMSAWYILSSIGLYQVDPAGGVFLIGSPSVHKAEIDVGNGRTFVVEASGNSEKNIYVAGARLDGRPYTKSYITYGDIMRGGRLELDMSPVPAGFGAGEESRP